MILFFISMMMSVMLAYGMSIAFTEKGNDWPIKKYRVLMQLFLRKFLPYKFCQVFYCTTCCSFWTSLISDIVLFSLNLLIFNSFYFFWPFSGFITLGLTWTIIEFLNSQETNIQILNEK